VLGPTIIAGHETGLKQVAVDDSVGRVFLLIPIYSTWTTYKIIPLVCLGHFEKITHAVHEIG
jgi:hypothetical protein